jgi:hypothetical protein
MGNYEISAPPSQPYLVGLRLNKVGGSTGWTTGAIELTDVQVPFPAPTFGVVCGQNLTDQTPLGVSPGILLSQYVVGNQSDIVWGGDSGSPVFRVSHHGRPPGIELYGILWGSYNGYTKFIFSPIGDSPYQPAGIQTDLGPLDYISH